MKITITGASGLLGKYLLSTQPIKDTPEGIVEYEHEITPCYRNNKIKGGIKLDVSNFAEVVEVLFKAQPDIIIHCAANGDVDSVEQNPGEAVKADLLGTIHLKDYAERVGCKLITISTNAVYDGKHAPYDETSVRAPINFYGKIKSLADDIIMKSTCEWIIIRPIFMYGWNWPHGRDNWATKIIKSLKEGKELNLVDDVYTQPTYAGDVAGMIWTVIKDFGWKKELNISSNERVNLFELGKVIAKVFKLKGVILPAKIREFKGYAPRPIDTCFGHIGWIGTFSTIKEGLKKMRDERD